LPKTGFAVYNISDDIFYTENKIISENRLNKIIGFIIKNVNNEIVGSVTYK